MLLEDILTKVIFPAASVIALFVFSPVALETLQPSVESNSELGDGDGDGWYLVRLPEMSTGDWERGDFIKP